MTKDEAMKMVLEAIAVEALRQANDQFPDTTKMSYNLTKAKQYLTQGALVPVDIETTTLLLDALRQALEQPDDAAWARYLKEPMSEKCIQEGDTIVPSDYSGKAGDYTEQESVYAFRRKGLDDFCTCDKRRYDELASKPNLFEVAVFYTAPPKREWVGLTDKEIQQVVYDLGTIGDLSHDEFDIARAVAQALKERNT